MKIIGLGNDIISIDRIESSFASNGERLKNRVFTPHEIEACEARGNGAIAAFARRFAAKEACAKALGTGIAKGVNWTDMEVHNDENGAPYLKLVGGAAERLASLTPDGMTTQIALTLTDDKPWACAVVLITAGADE